MKEAGKETNQVNLPVGLESFSLHLCKRYAANTKVDQGRETFHPAMDEVIHWTLTWTHKHTHTHKLTRIHTQTRVKRKFASFNIHESGRKSSTTAGRGHTRTDTQNVCLKEEGREKRAASMQTLPMSLCMQSSSRTRILSTGSTRRVERKEKP